MRFQVSSSRIHPAFIVAYAEIKRAAAGANVRNGKLDRETVEAIVSAAQEVVEGGRREQSDLDVFQAGAGTSYNMNLNEVIANRALELLGHARGEASDSSRPQPWADAAVAPFSLTTRSNSPWYFSSPCMIEISVLPRVCSSWARMIASRLPTSMFANGSSKR